MSVIEDALRRAELQGRSTPPPSVAQPTHTATATAVVQRAVLTPSTGASAHHARTAPNSSRVETAPAKPKFTKARASKPGEVIAPRKRYIGTMLIAGFASLVVGHQFLEMLLENPPLPAIIVAESNASTTIPTRHAIATKSHTPDSLTTLSGATLSNDEATNNAVNRPVPIDTSSAASPAHIPDRAPPTVRPHVNLAQQSATDAVLIESINRRFHVAGVMVSAGRRLAVINDVVVGLGDRVDGAIVRAVDARGAVIEVDGMEHHLKVSARGRNENDGRAANN